MRSIIYIRKVYQMAVISIVLVALLTFIIVMSLPSSSTQDECAPLNIVLDITPPSTLRLSWDSNECALAYNMTHYVNGVPNFRTIPYPIVSVNPDWNFCSNNIIVLTIIPRAAAGTFTPEVVEFGIGINGDGLVRGLQFDEENSRFVWDAPQNFHEDCNIQYMVDFKSEYLSEQVNITDEFYDITVHPCSTNTIDVITLIGVDNSYTAAMSSYHIGPTRRETPTAVSTDPHLVSADVIWDIESEPNNVCEIDALTFQVVTDDLNFQGEFPTGFDSNVERVTFTLTSLAPETIYQHRACFILSDFDPICSEYVRFLTRPLAEPILVVDLDLSENFLTISWDQDYHEGFVTRNLVLIQPMRSLHFLPSECDVDMNSIERDFTPDKSTFEFTDARPSFQYKITVITHFETLGRTTSSDPYTINTNEENPGDLGAHAEYQFVPDSPYSVSISAEWGIPCDINGPIRRFAYTLSGSLISGLTAPICQDVTLLSGDITTNLERDEPHVISATGILPFFEYKLIITTHLEELEKTTVIELGPAPQPYTPPSLH